MPVRDMSETLRATFRRVLRLENKRAAIRPGRLERIPSFESAILGNTRLLLVGKGETRRHLEHLQPARLPPVGYGVEALGRHQSRPPVPM